MQSTRRQILEYLQRHGRGTVKELGQLLGLTSTGIRQHLTVLERDGLVDVREERGHVGRPTLVYSLTEKADALFPKTYDVLVNCTGSPTAWRPLTWTVSRTSLCPRGSGRRQG